ncbi:NAD(P)/FAD-dependent oxidoreductase [Paractinoplanes brasiliensis]|uniref:3-phenylpropionate/trans-cinnamate dioxygenase ferredoxin reductase subunit n=1 Tax=Paractinoplanes brasiliensis TaxID=52695 RepID=A0A4R6JJY1_9ACTN|nr:FAD-dependent oxidoreductase [Actinoplanes brasiliensis]TDO36523.1 3-phenylpropionate/trans-cinnamate dioxygenase ferredoxin reductase subunit [Actinoplanes brasiliensis]GID32579.1 ferredoxin [Actinoplanes brasiliensis]
MTADRTFVIVGAGQAGANAAETLRAEGFAGRVVLLGAEPHFPYERPPLSKAVLLGKDEPDSVFLHDDAWYAEQDVEVHIGAAAHALDRAARQVSTRDGRTFHYDRLLLATGSSPRSLPVAGADLDGVVRLRTLTDSRRLAGRLRTGARLVIVGAGWIGLEVAAAASAKGADVTVVEAASLPLQRVLGERMARYFAGLHTGRGVHFRFGNQVTEIRGDGRVSQVVLADGSVLGADTVLVAVGVRPDMELAETAGLACDDGILVDQRLRTSDPLIFAAGDAARVGHPLLRARVRSEHWDNAVHTGTTAARAMLDQDVVHDRVPYFFSDQYDLGMEYTGWVPPGHDAGLVIRGDLGSGEFLAFWTERGRVLAGMNVNVWDVADRIEALVRAGLRDGLTVPADRLADPAVPLSDLLR